MRRTRTARSSADTGWSFGLFTTGVAPFSAGCSRLFLEGGYDAAGYDLLGVVTGSEGLLGVVTEVTVRLVRKPETARAMLLGFPSVEAAGATIFGPTVTTNTTRSVAWNVARACTLIKPCMDDAKIPVHPNVGMGVCGVPMTGFPPHDAVSRVAKGLVEILRIDGL